MRYGYERYVYSNRETCVECFSLTVLLINSYVGIEQNYKMIFSH